MSTAPGKGHARRDALVAGGGALTVFIAFLLVTGVSPRTALLVTLVMAVQSLSGAVVWRWMRRSAGAVECLGMGIALGTAAAVLSGLATSALIGSPWGWLVPSTLVAIACAWRSRRARTSTHDDTRPEVGDRVLWLTVIASAGLGVVSLLPNIARYPLSWTGTWGGFHADMLFFEALSNSLARYGPLDSIFTPDSLIRYHWLAYAWAGQVSASSAAEPFAVLTRVLPLASVIGSCLIAISWARQMSPSRWAPMLAVVLLVFGGYVGATYGAVFNFDSPSQSLTMMWLLALAFAATSAAIGAGSTWPWLIALSVLSFCLAGGKISAGAVGLAAMTVLMLGALVSRRVWRARAIWLWMACTVGSSAGYLLVVAGSANPGGLRVLQILDRASSVQGLNPIPGSLGIVVGTGIMLIAISARWAGLLWLVRSPARRWEPATMLGVGFAAAGLATAVLLSGGLNDMWFALAASAPLSVISAVGVADAWRSVEPARSSVRQPAIAVTGAVVIVGAVTALWLTGASGGNVWVGTWRWLGPPVAVIGALLVAIVLVRTRGRRAGWPTALIGTTIVVLVLVSAPGRLLGVGTDQVGRQPGLSSDAFAPIEEYVPGIDSTIVGEMSADDLRAGEWLSKQGDGIVATNVSFSPLVPAVSGVQTYASGVLYQAPYGRPSGIAPLLERERASWAFIDEPSVDTRDVLCRAGVQWAWVDPRRTPRIDWQPFARIVSASRTVTVLELACGAGRGGGS